MPLIQIELTEAEDARLVRSAESDRRSKRNQVIVLLNERLDQIDAEKTAETLRQSLQIGPDQSPPVPDALAADLGVKS